MLQNSITGEAQAVPQNQRRDKNYSEQAEAERVHSLAVHRSPFLEGHLLDFISFIWWYHSSLMLYDPSFLTLESVHLNNQAPLPDLQVCFGRDSFSPVSSTVYSGCV